MATTDSVVQQATARRSRVSRSSVSAIMGLLLCMALSATSGPAAAERNLSAQRPATANAKAARDKQLRLNESLATVIRLDGLDSATIGAVRAENAKGGLRALKLGMVIDVTSVGTSRSDALQWHSVAGGRAASWRVSSEGAQALRIELSVERAPAGAQVRFAPAFDAKRGRDARLPRSGVLWSPVVEGDAAIVELFIPDGAAPAAVSVAIASVAHHVVDPLAPQRGSVAKSAGAPTCEVDLACVAGRDAALMHAGAAVSRITYISAGYVWACTGTLLNPADGSFTPYYYTAAHCIHDQAAASTAVTLWFDETASCGGESAQSPVQVDGGAQLLVADTSLDGALLQLANAPPDGAVFAGWDSLPTDSGAAIVAIHHPRGGLKKVSEGTSAGYSDDRFMAATWTMGITEGGSSGSAMFTAIDSPRRDYLVRGTLVGGTSACTAAAPTSSGFDVYSRFDLMWPKLAPYLGANLAGRNFTGMWWNAEEPGWGININHQQGVIVATLFSYSDQGDPQWLIASALHEQADGDFTGELFQMTGPRFDATPWTRTTMRTVGSMRIIFSGSGAAQLAYTVDGKAVTEDISPMPVGDGAAPVCSFTDGSRDAETNYQDLWWDASESGWGLAVAHQGDTLFTALFSYGDDGRPMWLVGSDVRRLPDGTYAGTLYRTNSPGFHASSAPSASAMAAGTIALSFANGDSATLTYSVDGRQVRKPITRFSVSPSVPVCR